MATMTGWLAHWASLAWLEESQVQPWTVRKSLRMCVVRVACTCNTDLYLQKGHLLALRPRMSKHSRVSFSLPTSPPPHFLFYFESPESCRRVPARKPICSFLCGSDGFVFRNLGDARFWGVLHCNCTKKFCGIINALPFRCLIYLMHLFKLCSIGCLKDSLFNT